MCAQCECVCTTKREREKAGRRHMPHQKRDAFQHRQGREAKMFHLFFFGWVEGVTVGDKKSNLTLLHSDFQSLKYWRKWTAIVLKKGGGATNTDFLLSLSPFPMYEVVVPWGNKNCGAIKKNTFKLVANLGKKNTRVHQFMPSASAVSTKPAKNNGFLRPPSSSPERERERESQKGVYPTAAAKASPVSFLPS